MNQKHTHEGNHIDYDSSNWVILKDGVPIDCETVYSSGSVIEMINDGFVLGEGEKFVDEMNAIQRT
jgi:hypothetical protein